MNADGTSTEPTVAPATLASLLRGAGTELTSTVEGTSMGATIPHGAEIRIRCGVEARPGDVVGFLLEERLTAHRVMAVVRGLRRRRYLVTRGDAMTVCDPPIAVHDVLGAVTAVRVGDTWHDLAPPIPRRGWRGAAATTLDRGVAITASVSVRLAAGLTRLARRARRVRARFSRARRRAATES